MHTSRGLSLNGVLSCVFLAMLLGAAIAPAFKPIPQSAPVPVPEAPSLGTILMPHWTT